MQQCNDSRLDHEYSCYQVREKSLEILNAGPLHDSLHSLRKKVIWRRSQREIQTIIYFRPQKHHQALHQLPLGLTVVRVCPDQLLVDIRLARHRPGRTVQLLPEHQPQSERTEPPNRVRGTGVGDIGHIAGDSGHIDGGYVECLCRRSLVPEQILHEQDLVVKIGRRLGTFALI